MTGKEFDVVLANRRPGDPATLVGASGKAKAVLGWKPMYADIETIVSHAWNWHEKQEY